jgi:hypothetical protein
MFDSPSIRGERNSTLEVAMESFPRQASHRGIHREIDEI